MPTLKSISFFTCSIETQGLASRPRPKQPETVINMTTTFLNILKPGPTASPQLYEVVHKQIDNYVLGHLGHMTTTQPVGFRPFLLYLQLAASLVCHDGTNCLPFHTPKQVQYHRVTIFLQLARQHFFDRGLGQPRWRGPCKP